MTRIETLKSQVARLFAATTAAQVGAVHAEMVGYDSHADDPQASLGDLQDLALDFVREACYAEGIPTGLVGLLPPECEPPACPQCGGAGGLLGHLGTLAHYRCRDCGWGWQ